MVSLVIASGGQRITTASDDKNPLGEWYRFEDKRYAGPLDEYDQPTPSTLTVHLRKYKVLKITPKGAWVHLGPFSGKRFVRRDVTRRFACPTVEEALESFKARKAKQARIYRKRADDADRASRLAENMVNSPGHRGLI